MPADNAAKESYDDIKPGLSEQELAALADDSDAGDEVAAGGEQDPGTENSLASPSPEDQSAEPAAAGGDTPDAPPETEAEAEMVAEQAAADAAASADDDAAESGAPPNAEPDEIPRGMNMFTQIQPTRQFHADISGRINQVDAEIDALEAKLDEGELQLSEFMRESRRLNNERQELVADRREQEILQNTNTALYETDWNTSVGNFMADNEQFQNPIMMGALEAALKELYANPDNVGSSHFWYLETARRAVMDQVTPSQATAENPPDNQESPQQQRRQQIASQQGQRAQQAAKDRQQVPQNLANVPASEDNPGDDDEFSHLDRLEGVELEQALAKMSDAQVDRYLRAGQ
jgi:hypothetical protein